MSHNSSDERGWITPLRESPLYDEDLDRLLSRWMRGVSGLPDGNIRPRWQPKQSALLPPDVNWCAFGVINIESDDNPAFINQGDKSSKLWRQETIECLASFYGPNGQRYAARFRDGVTVNHNNDELNAFDLTLAKYGQIISFPELINNQWLRRYDLTVILRRSVTREYGINSLLDAPIKFFGD